MKKTIITICGLPGSGKSSTAMRLAQTLAYKHFSSGDFARQIAQRRSVNLDQLQSMAEIDPTIDIEIDEAVRATGEEENLVIDSRTAFHWIPQSFKVFLKIDPKIAAERTFVQLQNGGRVAQQAHSVEEVYENLVARIDSECKRYSEKYAIDYRDEAQFDLVVDTAAHPLDEVVQIISEKYQGWLAT